MATLLIIDDDLELFSLLSACLNAEGFDCVHVAAAEKGLRLEQCNFEISDSIMRLRPKSRQGVQPLRGLSPRTRNGYNGDMYLKFEMP